MIGKRIAHFEIAAHVGSGGMGDVYQAMDVKLGRDDWPLLVFWHIELSHMENRQQFGRVKNMIHGILYVRSAKFRTRIERETDQRAIDKGYGAALLALHEYHDQLLRG